MKADTIATAIKIGNPVNFPKAVRTLRQTNGVVETVTDQEIMDAKALIDGRGIGCEPASACSLAGARKLATNGIIRPDETVVGILTGHLLKDPDATIGYHQNRLNNITAQYPNKLHQAEANIEEITRILTTT
jgi:threonine synthase